MIKCYLRIFFLVGFLSKLVAAFPALAVDPDISKQYPNSKVTTGSDLYSPSKKWRFALKKKEEMWILEVHKENQTYKLDDSNKPSFRVLWSSEERYIAVVRPVGFVTMLKIFRMDVDSGPKLLYSSEKINGKYFVNYGLASWDLKDGVATLGVWENNIYDEQRSHERLLAIEYVYLDGSAADHYGLSEGSGVRGSGISPHNETKGD